MDRKHLSDICEQALGYDLNEQRMPQAVLFVEALFDNLPVVAYCDETGAVASEAFELNGQHIKPLYARPEI